MDGYFATEREGCPAAAAGQARREAEFQIFHRYARPLAEVDDFELEACSIALATGESQNWAETGILGYSVLADLPQLRELQEETRRLDVRRLSAIESTLNRLNDLATPDILADLDEYLVKVFTPRRVGAELPSPSSLRRRLRERIQRIDSGLAPSQKKIKDRKKRKDAPFGTCRGCFYGQDDGDAGLSVSGDAATIGLMERYTEQVAREHKLSQDDALEAILTGRLRDTPKVVLYMFTPKTPGSSYYIPNFGWTDAEGTAAVEEMLESAATHVVDLDEAEQAETEAYAPTTAIRALVQARDGVCLWPGCNVKAENCQLDHRIPFDEGGKTTPSNLFSLCAHHHNLKTDRRVFYVPDPVTGEIVWLHVDGTFHVAEPEGYLTDYLQPAHLRWKMTLEQRRQKRKDRAEFYHRCHSAVEQYENDWDYDTCMATIRAMEDRFGMTFEYPPRKEPEDTPQLLAALEEHLRDLELSPEDFYVRDYPLDHDFGDPEVPSYA